MDRIFICDLLLKRNENCPFLKWMITGEKWIIYNNSNNNVQRKRSWGKKINRHKPHRSKISIKEVMLCIWWNCKGIVYYELLCNKTRWLIPRNIVPNWTVWRQQLTKSIQNSNRVVFRIVVSCFIKTTLNLISLTTRQKLLQFGMSCLICLICLILHRQIFIYLELCKILLLEKISLLWKIAKSILKRCL